MISGIWGKKIGMTQLYVGDKVVPVTAITVAHWIVTNLKTLSRDGYNAVQVGCLRKRFIGKSAQEEWFKKPTRYFSIIREIRCENLPENIKKGDIAPFYNDFAEGDRVHVTGITKGRGFAGVVRRHDFAGARSSHGSAMGKRTGALSFMRSQGKVIKGKAMPGHMGTEQRVMQNLVVIKKHDDGQVLLIKGSVPGHAGSLIFVAKK